jgi:hypothetical protein
VLAMRSRRPGDRVTIGLMHDGHYRTVPAFLVEQPPNPESS